MSLAAKKPPRLWSLDEVALWLGSEGLAQLRDLFSEHGIDGECLPHLTDALMVEMGIDDAATRAKLANAIKFEASKNALKQDLRRPRLPGSPLPAVAVTRSTSGGNLGEFAGAGRGLVALYTEAAPVPPESEDTLYAHADRYGFLDDEGDGPGEASGGKESRAERRRAEQLENQRALKWAKMVSGADVKVGDLKNDPKFRRRVYKGIPNPWRLKVWLLMTLGAADELDQRQVRLYQDMLAKPTSEVDENQIDLDINRTLRNHIVYRQRYGPGQQRLFNVLRAYANYNPEVGFCQGMASVAAFLLIYCKEETTFWIMDKLVSHENFRLKGIWAAGFPMLMEGFYVHERMLKFHVPKLFKHFKNHNIHPSAYATRWYMTIFLGFPFHTCLRIWDVFLMHGFDVLFFVAVAVLEIFQNDLLSLDFEGMMEFLGQMSKQEIDDDRLVRAVIRLINLTHTSMPGRAQALAVLRREYHKSQQARGGGLQLDD